ncbi:hypothetical protein FUAX_37760 [Fulvitalea axinellae]|uniref:3-hydroxyacyl-CoA dehydrogenase C-terminal domain-containing protein n=1 Tax=Fulvitalea axinellae TaxID=1182444 RepID=A0AAU9D9T3_9BACT|nr:hypothetical protein FUAX_37760 [Fulvitalea axinellae]
MKVLVIGTEPSLEEFKAKFTAEHEYDFRTDYDFGPEDLENTDVVFDYLIDENPEALELYLPYAQLTAFLSVPKTSLAELTHVFGRGECTFVGFNGLASFTHRRKLEVSLLFEDTEPRLAEICKALGTEYLLVQDRVGMVIPRLMVAIVNEAYYTLQDGTATREDIDTAMRLRNRNTNGPFEWCKRVGIDNIYEILEALYEDTKDERYKISPLLKREYLLR